MRLFFLFLFISSSLFGHLSTSSELASLEGDPSLLIEGCVNPITGDLLFEETDCLIRGAEPISLTRRYTSREVEAPHLKWQLIPHAKAIFITDGHITAYIPEPSGISLFYLPKKEELRTTFVPFVGQFGAGLTHQEGSSYHPGANVAYFENNQLVVSHSDGSYRTYAFDSEETHLIAPMTPRITTTFFLKTERLPSGHIREYTWKTKKGIPCLRKIETFSPSGALLAKAKVNILEDDSIQVTTSDGRKLLYYFREKYDFPVLHKILSPEKPEETLSYHHSHHLKERLFPNGRFLRFNYDKQGRVKSLVGPEHLNYTFTYEEGCTRVVDSEEHLHLYHFDTKTLRLLRKETFQGARLVRREAYTHDRFGNLIQKTIGDETVALTLSYAYDREGKLIQKTIAGPITSSHAIDSYTTWLTYDEKNRRLEEREEGGKSTQYSYLKDTNLPTEILYKNRDTLCKRVRYIYDPDHFLIEEITDDGDNPTEETTLRYIRKKSAPFYGMVDAIEEYSGGQLLKKSLLEYDPFGKIQNEAIYDQEGTYRYTEKSYHDAKGQLVKSTDAEGNSINYTYDENGNLIQTISPLRNETRYTYDLCNRLLSEEIAGEKTLYTYFPSGYLATRTDFLKATTQYTYDPCGNKTTLIDPCGHRTTYTYDPLGYCTSETNPLGITTETTRNLHGDPLTITYPDGSKETYTYTLEGKLATSEDPSGVITTYTYDPYGNLSQTSTDSQTHIYIYGPSHLVSETDPVGTTTTYSYDLSGKLQAKTIGTHTTHYAYDTLGRQVGEKTADYTKETTLDLLGRTTSLCEYSHSTLLTQEDYTYDAESNLITHTTYPQNRAALTEYTYDSLNREISRKNPIGQIFSTSYIPQDKKLLIITTSPGEIVETKTESALGYTLEIEKTFRGEPLTSTIYTYDAAHNLTSQKTGSHTLTYTHDLLGRKTTETECGQKTTQYTYTPNGQIKTIKKPSGILLIHTYDLLGNLIRLTSNDATIDYTYEYNLRGDLLRSNDQIRGTYTEKTIDPYGNLIKETLANGLTFLNNYDSLNRRTHLTLPSGTTVTYTYQGPYLSTVSFGPYTHTYRRDLAGNPTHQTTIFGTPLSTTYDRLARPSCYQAEDFFQTCTYNWQNCITQMLYRGTHFRFTYDLTCQLTSELYHEYDYDKIHNRISHNEIPLSYNTLNERTDIPYDLDGNPLTHASLPLTYDALGRLTQAGPHTYTYDAEHRRVTCNGTAHYWDGSHELGTHSLYRILGDTPHAEIGAAIALVSEVPLLPIHDLQGNLIEIRSPTGPLEVRSFSAFGETAPLTIPWGFASKTHDSGTGLIYFGRRYYDPQAGRFLTPDPAGHIDSPNLYAYTLNNPLTNRDPHGLLLRYWADNPEDYYQSQIGALDGGLNFLCDTASSLCYGGLLGSPPVQEAIETFRCNASRWIDTTFDADRTNPYFTTNSRVAQTAAELVRTFAAPLRSSLPKTTLQFARKTKKEVDIWLKGSPLKNRTAAQLHELFIKKGFKPEGKDCVNGLGNYIHPKSLREYHIDPRNVGRYRKPNHVDVSRPEKYNGPLPKKRLGYKDDSSP